MEVRTSIFAVDFMMTKHERNSSNSHDLGISFFHYIEKQIISSQDNSGVEWRFYIGQSYSSEKSVQNINYLFFEDITLERQIYFCMLGVSSTIHYVICSYFRVASYKGAFT